MIAKEELKRIAKIKGLSLGNAEKDYLIDLALLSISRNSRDELVFKGGTCLYKFHKLERFSEDIDFTQQKEIDIDRLIKKIISDLNAFGIGAGVRKQRSVHSSISISLRSEGPLYNGNPHTYSGIRIDINQRSSIDMEPVNKRHTSIYSEVPPYSILTMPKREILAEKIRALLTRGKARDVYDVWFLMRNGVKVDRNMLNLKLKYYDLVFSREKLMESIEEKRIVWETELKPLLGAVPPFGRVMEEITSGIK